MRPVTPVNANCGQVEDRCRAAHDVTCHPRIAHYVTKRPHRVVYLKQRQTGIVTVAAAFLSDRFSQDVSIFSTTDNNGHLHETALHKLTINIDIDIVITHAPIILFRSVIVGKLLYASCAWIGIVSNSDRKRVDAFLQLCKRCGFCPSDLSRFDELLEDADSTLFKKVIADNRHVLHQLLPPLSSASHNYSLRGRTHQFRFYRTAQAALWIVTFLSDPCLRKDVY